jgi:glycosyltransferase involved in cell wall biosynthesis
MKLDVLIATYNRCKRLELAIRSLLRAPVPNGLEVRIVVVDNNSQDGTRDLVSSIAQDAHLPVEYLFEPRQGKCAALNRGIATATGDLVGMIDDDEQVDPNWFRVVWEAFQDPDLGFIGGPYLPDWESTKPPWLPERYTQAVIGWFEYSPVPKPYGPELPGALMYGGNAVILRTLLNRVGPYDVALGPTAKKLLRGDDDDMFERLMQTNTKGTYLPQLIIYHHITTSRLTKKYFRRWCWGTGVSYARLSRNRGAQVTTLFGAPRYLYRKLAEALFRLVFFVDRRSPTRAFSNELDVWHYAGQLYGNYFSPKLMDKM